MRISKECFDIVKGAVEDVLSQGFECPRKFLTEHDLQAWIFRELIAKLNMSMADSVLGIHCQTRFLDSDRLLHLEPDIAIFNSDEYTIEPDGALTKRKGYTFWGSSILIEIKLLRGCRKIALLDSILDIDKLSLIRELHYSAEGQLEEYHPVFVLFSRPTLTHSDRRVLEEHAKSKNVSILLADAKQES